MNEKIRTKVVYCKQKKRYVEIEFTGSGPWYSPCRKLVSCPAATDPGQSCDYSCLGKLDVPALIQDRRVGPGY